MLSNQVLDIIRKQDHQFADSPHLKAPKYDPLTHYLEVADSPYYTNLISFRHIIKLLSDSCMGLDLNAKNIDLFMLTPSISSPMGPGYVGHSVVVCGYDDENIIVNEPGLPGIKDWTIPHEQFLKGWSYPDATSNNITAVRPD